MVHYKHWCIILFYTVFFFLPTSICLSQQNSIKKQGNLFFLANNKVDSFLENDFLLMNARYFIVKHPRSKGKPYFEVTNNAPGKLVIDKKEYNNLRLIYDIWDQKLNLIIEKDDNKGIILELNNQVITRFYLDDKIFVNSAELPLFPQSGFYEEIFLGKHINVYAKWSKHFIDNVTDGYLGEFSSPVRKLLFEINGEKVDISSKRSYLKIFDGESKKIKSFMKKNKIHLSRANNIDLIKLFRYTDSLL